ncbi:type II secretion system F family protein [Pseudonocardia parietis]|uniref:Flp pilus assembly protein TadB n=1 Tax=Pseudonocardia parietis TaxID=570936 RepID=A0ABS4VKE9_9PSEU|nr:type II secretion system F family protein [Pseudonocardia parietis]MBP2364402.1 Flp pilus assembly protein TadB [Pseudonocardia parietis]
MTATALGLAAVAVLLGGARPAPGRLRDLRGRRAGRGSAQPPRTVVLALLVPAGTALGWAVAGTTGAVVGTAAGAGLMLLARRLPHLHAPRADDADLAAVWDLLATCLAAGLTVPDALDAAGRRLPGPAGATLRRVSGLLALGASADDAWSAAAATPGLAGFARAAGRSASTGSALGRAASTEAARLRAGLTDRAEERAQRAAVLITAPLGLCFLPAFLVLGIVPVVIGLAGEAFARW